MYMTTKLVVLNVNGHLSVWIIPILESRCKCTS
uniref:Uncharacterized protein n=1 Tax=Anguilla anguilla TaxID=7936 RepID=A0A0E9TZB7_ANGAN